MFVIYRFPLSSLLWILWGEVNRHAAMMKAGATKVGLPKPGFQERAKQASLATASSTTSTAIKTSRSSSTLSSDHRLSKVSQRRTANNLTI